MVIIIKGYIEKILVLTTIKFKCVFEFGYQDLKI